MPRRKADNNGRRRSTYTAIVENPGREQPWTVWVDGWVVKFCFTREEAESVFRAHGGTRWFDEVGYD